MAQTNLAVKQDRQASSYVDVTGRNRENMIAMRGTEFVKEEDFSDPVIAKLFANQYPYINSRLYAIQVFGPNVVSEETVDKCTEIIEGLLKKDTSKINTQIAQVTHVIQEGMGEIGNKALASTVKFPINSRLSNVVFQYFKLCDEYIGLVKSAWMFGLMSDAEMRKVIGKIRANVRSITKTTEVNSGRIFNLVREAQKARNNQQQNKVAEIAAAKPGKSNAKEKAMVAEVVAGNKEALKAGEEAANASNEQDTDDTPVKLDVTSSKLVAEVAQELESATS